MINMQLRKRPCVIYKDHDRLELFCAQKYGNRVHYSFIFTLFLFGCFLRFYFLFFIFHAFIFYFLLVVQSNHKPILLGRKREPEKVLQLLVKVGLRVIAMKGYTLLPINSKTNTSYENKVCCYTQGTSFLVGRYNLSALG